MGEGDSNLALYLYPQSQDSGRRGQSSGENYTPED